MKTVIFILKNVLHSFKAEKFLSLLLILGMIVCDTIFLVFGHTFWADTKSNRYEIYANNMVTFQFNELDIDGFLDAVMQKEYITSASFSHVEYSGTSTTVVSAYFPEFDINMAGRLTGSQLSGKDNEFLINDNYLDNNRFSEGSLVKIGDLLTFAEKERICVGIISTGTADRFDFLIGINDFKNSINNGITAVFRFKDGTSVLEIKDYANEISAMFGAQYFVMPQKTTTVSFTQFLSDMSGMLVLLIIAIINYMFIYRYLLMKRTYIHGVYKMMGMNDFLTLSLLSSEMLVLLVLSYSISIILYLTGLSIRSQLVALPNHIPELGFAFIIILILNIVFFIIASAKTIMSSPNQLIRQSEVK